MGSLVFAIAWVVIMTCVVYSLANVYSGSKHLAEEERGKKPIYYEQCGGRFDLYNLTLPFVRFAVYENFLVVAYGKKQYVLYFNQIHGISIKWILFAKGIQIRHSRNDIPEEFIICSRNTKKAMDVLNKMKLKIETT